ncbi:MAG: methyltransferase domain-containing protein [Clostridiales bacterium]|nr:methyltransferase domain-containing protein [Clostridiales bacterium]
MLNVTIDELIKLSEKPALFTPGERLFWNDPHISKQMLAAHLDPNTDRASYRPETIEKIVDFTVGYLKLQQGDSILDAGCGPGLYCERFANAGFCVTGIDFSENSIRYAKESADVKGLKIQYINANYLDMSFTDVFNAVYIISQDFCVLSYKDRARFLHNVFNALKPGGYFVFDASTPLSELDISEQCSWYACDNGFWSSEPNLALEKRFYYPEDTTYLYQCIVATNNATKVYRIYQTHYTKESITGLLASHGFRIADIFEDLTGREYNDRSKTLGIIARK